MTVAKDNIFPKIRSTSHSSSDSDSHLTNIPFLALPGDRMFIQIVSKNCVSLTTPEGWEFISAASSYGSVRSTIFWRDKEPDDPDTVNVISSTKTKSVILSFAIKAGTFKKSPPILAFAAGASYDSPTRHYIDDPLGDGPKLVASFLGLDLSPSVLEFPLPDNIMQKIIATCGTAALCTIESESAKLEIDEYKISALVPWVAQTVIVRGAYGQHALG